MRLKSKFKLFPVIILLTILIAGIVVLLKSNSTENIPCEDPKEQIKLDKAISISKYSVTEGIAELEKLNGLPEYTDYKRNYILARLYEKKNDTENALIIYEKLLTKNYPLKERVLFHYASISSQVGDDIKALKYLNNVLREFPNSKSVPQTKYVIAQTQLRLRLTNQAIKTLSSLRSRFPNTQYGIATNYYLGEYSYNSKKYEEALQYWRQYLKLSPDGRFANEIANILESNKAIILKPSDYILLGDVFFHKKDYKKTAHYYKNGNDYKKYYNLGYALFRTNNKTEAIKYLKEYAYKFPKSDNARWALFYAGICTPSFLRKSFWEQVSKDVPVLSYYTSYKEAVTEQSSYLKEKLLSKYIKNFPDSIFTLDAVWEIMWQKIKAKNYTDAFKTGKEFFELSKDSPNEGNDTRLKIGFWLGKLSEFNGNKEMALEYYKETQAKSFDNYYSHRSGNRISALTGGNDFQWKLQKNITEFANYNWLIPNVIKPETIKTKFGATVAELINLQQFDEAMELIGKTKASSKQITVWLEALNKEYETSINQATGLATRYKYNSENPIWKLAYPLHFWQHTIANCKRYPGIDPFLVCGVIRQESRFDTNALSTSDARGLMQLIPPTAKSVSRQLNINLNSYELLNDPDINIALGTKYLCGLINDLYNPLLAVASYNAGPNAVKNWVNNSQEKDLDLFIEEIPYDQTKDYVKKVFSSYWTYLKIYSQ